jgi:hypothetical protein
VAVSLAGTWKNAAALIAAAAVGATVSAAWPRATAEFATRPALAAQVARIDTAAEKLAALATKDAVRTAEIEAIKKDVADIKGGVDKLVEHLINNPRAGR